MIRVYSEKAVPGDVVEAVTAACVKLPKLSPVKHALHVRLIDSYAIRMDDICPIVGGQAGTLAAGIFAEPKPGKNPWIVIAAGAAEYWQDAYGWSRKHALGVLIEQVCHEFAHYMQWRDGKPLTERGVRVRAKSLVRGLRSVKVLA